MQTYRFIVEVESEYMMHAKDLLDAIHTEIFGIASAYHALPNIACSRNLGSLVPPVMVVGITKLEHWAMYVATRVEERGKSRPPQSADACAIRCFDAK